MITNVLDERPGGRDHTRRRLLKQKGRTMTVRRRRVLLALTLAAIAQIATAQSRQRSVDAFFTAFTDEWMRLHTDQAASLRYFSGAAQDAVEREITPRTEAWREVEIRLARKGLDQIRAFDRSKLTDAQRLSLDVMAWDLDDRVQGEPFQDYLFPLVHSYGVQSRLVELLTIQHPVETPRDAENYVVRLGQLAQRMDEAVADARRLAAKKMIPPKFALESALVEMKSFVALSPTDNPLVATFAERMNRVESLPVLRRQQLRSAAEALVTTQVYPAWAKAIDLLESIVPQATDDAGLWRLPKGVDAYSYQLRHFTTTAMTAEEIHQTGLRMVAQIREQTEKLRTQLTADGSLPIRGGRGQVASVSTDDYKAEIDRTIRDAGRRAVLLFDRVPKADVQAQPYPNFFGDRAASYVTPAPDGSRPGVFQYALPKNPRGRFNHSIIYHETIPGHHFQLAFQLENTGVPRFRQLRIFGSSGAFVEGWGLYAERLAAESGWFDDDPRGRLEQLGQEFNRAERLVVDTGIHAKQWTQQQAVAYCCGASEIDRYVVWPGQATSYMIGELKLLELREKAKRELGDRFSLKEFHNLVLETGSVPLDILERQVNEYIRTKK
jgi:uncharacterized protein (DUF885 family)